MLLHVIIYLSKQTPHSLALVPLEQLVAGFTSSPSVSGLPSVKEWASWLCEPPCTEPPASTGMPTDASSTATRMPRIKSEDCAVTSLRAVTPKLDQAGIASSWRCKLRCLPRQMSHPLQTALELSSEDVRRFKTVIFLSHADVFEHLPFGRAVEDVSSFELWKESLRNCEVKCCPC